MANKPTTTERRLTESGSGLVRPDPAPALTRTREHDAAEAIRVTTGNRGVPEIVMPSAG